MYAISGRLGWRSAFAGGVLISICAQFHISFLAGAAIGFFAVVLFAEKFRWKVSLAFLGGFIIIYTPYFISEIANNFSNTRALFQPQGIRPGDSLDFEEGVKNFITHIVRMSGGRVINSEIIPI